MRDKIALLAVVTLLVTAGCTGAGGGSEQLSSRDAVQAGAGGEDRAAEASTEAAAATAAQSGDSQAVVRQNRQLIRTAELRVKVDSFEQASNTLRSVVRAQGGFVGEATRERRGSGNRTWTEGTLTLRVPAENYSTVIRAVNETGEVVAFSQQTKDVTDRIVDLEARLKNLRAERAKLRELFEQANDTEDVLAVQERLSEVQAEIERTEAQLKQLERQVALATITVRIEEEPPEPTEPERDRWYDTALTDAFIASINGVVVAARAGAVLLAYSLPYLFAFGLPVVGLVVVARRVRGGESDPPVDSETTVESEARTDTEADLEPEQSSESDRSDASVGEPTTETSDSSASDDDTEQ